MNELFKKGLVSLAAASVLTTGAVAESNGVFDSTISDAQITCDSDSVAKSDTLHCTLQLLDSDKEVDLAGPSTLDLTGKSTFTIISSLGGIITPNATNTINSAKALYDFNITSFESAGDATIQAIVALTDLDGDVKIVRTPEVPVSVTEAKNNAYYLEITSVEDENGNTISSTGITAGKTFSIKVSAKNSSGNPAEYQNSEVTLDIYNRSTKEKVYTQTGEIKSGSAIMNIPADSLTKAGKYMLVVSAPTSVDTKCANDIAGDKRCKTDEIADNYYDLGEEENLTVKALETVSNLSYSISRDDNNTFKINVKAVDAYGNEVSPDEDISIQCKVNDKDVGNDKINKSTNTDTNITTVDLATKLTSFSTEGKATVTLTCADAAGNYDSFSESVDVYAYEIDLNATGLDNVKAGTKYGIDGKDIPILALGTAGEYKTNSNGTVQAWNLNFRDGNETDITIKLYDKYGNLLETLGNIDVNASYVTNSGTNNDENGTIPLTLTKAVTDGKLEISGMVISGTDKYYIAPKYVDINVATGDFAKIEFNKYVPASVISKESFEEVDLTNLINETNLTILSYNNATITKDGNVSKDKNGDIGFYVLKGTDAYGNKLDSGAGESIKISDANSYFSTASYTGSLNGNDGNITTIKFNNVKSTTLEISADVYGGNKITKDVTVKDVIDSISDITVTGPDYVLVNSIIPLQVSVEDGKLDKVVALIGDVSKVKLAKDFALNSVVNNGEAVGSNAEDKKAVYVKALGTGEVTLTFRNTAGNVVAEKKLTIVKSLNDIPADDTTDDTTTVPKAEVEAAVVEAGEMDVNGYFAKYDFNADGVQDYNDWAYTVASNNNTYQLLGNPSNDTNLFGWKAADVTVDGKDWLMVHYGAGSLDWLVFKEDCSSVYKLSGANADGTFSYDVTGDGATDANDKLNLTCTVTDGKVTFTAK